MTDQFDELRSPESLREECRSLLAQIKMLERSQNMRYIQALEDLYQECFVDTYPVNITPDDLHYYIQRKKEEVR